MFGRKLKELRLEKKINQSELGEMIGISPSTVGMYERDQRFPDKDILGKLADYFEVSVDYLLGRTDQRNLQIKKTKLDEGITTINAKKINVDEDLPDEAYDKINEYIKMVEMMYKNKDK